MQYKIRPTKYNLYREGDNPIFGDSVTEIGIEDEAAGGFLIIRQHESDFGPGGILRFDLEELPTLIEAIHLMAKNLQAIVEESNDSDKL
jgi:hypothetical protein